MTVGLINRLISISLIMEMLISKPVWLDSLREFPTAPVIENLEWGVIGELLLVCILIASLILIIRPLNRYLIIVIVMSLFLLVLEDQNRLQPWVFLNSLILLCSVIYSDQKERYAITTILLILSASYFWGGLQKANFFFGTEMFPWLAEFTGQQAFLREHPIVGVLVAGIEALAGLGLMFGFSRKIAAIILLLMHVFILTALGPFGHNWNHVVWPWNICFALLLFVLSNKKDIKLWERTLFRKKYYIFFFVAVAALPSLGVLGKWDHFLSGGYYSAVIPEAIFYYHEKDRSNLPESSTDFQYFTKGTREEFVLIDQWALNHLGVPSYPEIRVKKQIGKKLCSCLDYPKKAGLRIHYKYRFTQGRFETLEFPCSSLGFITGGLE